MSTQALAKAQLQAIVKNPFRAVRMLNLSADCPAWAGLPNTSLIDDILADVSARIDVWAVSGDNVRIEKRFAVRGAAREAAHLAYWSVTPDMEREAVWAAIRNLDGQILRVSAGDAISALVTWPASADLLSLTPDALRTIIEVCDGDVKHQAVLLLPAVIARHTT